MQNLYQSITSAQLIPTLKRRYSNKQSHITISHETIGTKSIEGDIEIGIIEREFATSFIALSGVNVNGNIIIRDLSVLKNLLISNCETGNVFINDTAVSLQNISISSNSKIHHLEVHKPGLEILINISSLTALTCHKDVKIISIYNSKIQAFNKTFYFDKSERVFIIDNDFVTLRLIGVLGEKSKVVLEKPRFNHLITEEFANLGELSINNTQKCTHYKTNFYNFSFLRSNLAKAQLFNIDFYNADKIKFKNSKIIEVETAVTYWSKNPSVYIGDNLSMIQQIKRILKREGQDIELAEMQEVEIDLSRERIRIDYDQKRNWQKRLIFEFNYFTNRNRRSWFRAMKVYAVSGTVLYFILLEVLQCFNYENILYLPVFLNPAHSIRFIDELCNCNMDMAFIAYLIDGVSRFWLAAVAYQFIAAFRKYTLK